MKTLRILLVEKNKVPKVVEIPHTLEAMHEIVNGYIETVYPFEDEVALICNDEGKFSEPANRALYDENGEIYEVICGSFFIVGIDTDDFVDLSDELCEKYGKRFENIERFALGPNHSLIVFKEPGQFRMPA